MRTVKLVVIPLELTDIPKRRRPRAHPPQDELLPADQTAASDAPGSAAAD